MNIMGNNLAGIFNKLDSFKQTIQKFAPGVFFAQETKSRRKNQVKINDYVMFEHIRKDKGGGGLLTAVHKNLHPVSVSDESDVEILVVQGSINNKKVRFINGYGPQEKEIDENRMKFFNKLDFEVKRSHVAGDMICIQMDANSKLGADNVPGDPDEQSKNGKVLEKVIIDNDLIVANGTKLCSGIITRYRKTKQREEKSVIDFFIVCQRFFNLIKSMLIDEKRIYTITKYNDKNGNKNVKQSDHNLMMLNIDSNWRTSIDEKKERIEIYNYKNKEDFEQFKNETENNPELRD